MSRKDPLIDGVLQFDFPRNPVAPAGGDVPFVVGRENSLVAPAVDRLLRATDPAAAAAQFNPLVVVGPSGSGKSHLVQGLVRAWSQRIDSAEIAYFTAADFGRERQAAEADERLIAWRQELRAVRLLVIDDVDRLRQRDTIQRELRQTIETLVDRGAVVLVTALREPKTVRHLEPGLRDRLSGGLTVRLQRPELAARRAILAHAAAARGIVLEGSQLDRLACKECATPAQLLGRLAGAIAKRSELSTTTTILEKGSSSTSDLSPVLKQLLAITARYFTVTQAALVSPARRKSLVVARNVFVHLARRHTGASYATIGRSLGGRDHTTIMHADRRLNDWLASDPAIQQAVDELDRLVGV